MTEISPFRGLKDQGMTEIPTLRSLKNQGMAEISTLRSLKDQGMTEISTIRNLKDPGMTDISHGDWCTTCVGCGGLIQDQFILRVSPDLSWHAACLKCCECSTLLDEKQTCFVREGKPFCKQDYVRLYSARCASCEAVFSKNDFVMRAKSKMFHLECFRCSICSRNLVPGDEFALHGSGLLCRDDHEMVEREDNNNITIKAEYQDHFRDDNLSEAGGREEDGFREDLSSLDVKSETDTIRAESPDSTKGDSGRQDRLEDIGATGHRTKGDPSSPSPPSRGRGKGRSNRGRTVLTEKQRTILTACFQHNPKPDALLKEQLVEMTGLNARVIRVWFQNRRCKEHKRVKAEVLITRKDHQKIGYGSMTGISMLASSPVRQESPVDMSAVDISGFQSPWHNLQDLQMRMENHQFNPPPNQVHGFEPGSHDHLFPLHPGSYSDQIFPPRSSCPFPMQPYPPDRSPLPLQPYPTDRSPLPRPFNPQREGLQPFTPEGPERRRLYPDPPLDRGQPFSEQQNSDDCSPFPEEMEQKS